MANKLTPKQVKKKVESLKADRGTLDSHVQEIFDFMLPRKATVTTQQTPGAKRSVFVLDNTGMYCLELLAGQLHGLLTSPNGMWFELTTGVLAIDERDDVRFWLQKTSKDIHNVLNNSNFQTEVHELYIDEVSAGTACMYSEEDDRDVVRFSTKFFGEYYVDEDAQGRVNQLYRVWKWKAPQLVEEFGLDNVGKKVQRAYEKGEDHKFEVIHACYPKSLVNPKDKAGFEHVSQYMLSEEELELRVEGYREFPYVVPRWSKGTGEKYGRSPAMVALPEVKTLNKMAETMLIGAQKVIDPPLQMPDDGFVLPIITTPGGINYYRPGGNDKIEPIFNDTRIDFGYEAMKEKRTRIREAFFVDQLMLQQGPQMTATEVLQRTEEKMRLLGPMLGRQQSEFLRPLIDRVFNIMMRRGIIKKDEIPQVLRGRKIDVKYSSMIAKSQRLQDGQNIMRTLQAATPFINLDPSVADNINGDAALRVLGEVYGLPQQILRNVEDVQKIREQKAQAQQQMIEEQKQAQQIDNAQKGVGMMGELSKTQNQG
jgi:hypothetical protein